MKNQVKTDDLEIANLKISRKMWLLLIIGIAVLIAFYFWSNISARSTINDRSNSAPVDYSRLTALLAAGQWEEADDETTRVMCEAVGRIGYKSTLGRVHIKNFPCSELRTIDQLWLQYSDGHFGFSIQLEIWQRVQQTDQSARDKFYMLADIIGWITVSNDFATWLKWSELKYNRQIAPLGHLPSGKFRTQDGAGSWVGWEEFLNRISTCQM